MRNRFGHQKIDMYTYGHCFIPCENVKNAIIDYWLHVNKSG